MSLCTRLMYFFVHTIVLKLSSCSSDCLSFETRFVPNAFIRSEVLFKLLLLNRIWHT